MGKVTWTQGQVYTVDPAKDFDTMLMEQMAWEQINSHFAADLAGIYHKMGLNGFKRMKRYQSIKENKESAELRHYMIDYIGILPFEDFAYSSPMSIPSLKDGINLDHTLCEENIVRLNQLMKLALAEEKYCAVPMIDCLIKKECQRRVKLMREYTECEYVAWDKTYVMLHDKALHEKYKCKEKKKYGWKK
jgi:ferritin